ncbi:tripartite tricarboxylate transporter TctB family protein [Chloroflexota bacterium]
MKIKGSITVAMFFLLLGIFGITQSLFFGYWESMVLPLVISGLILILAAVEVGKELIRQRKVEAAAGRETAKDSKQKDENRRFGLILGWAVGFCLLIYLFGFYIAIPFFTFTYLKWRGRSWLAVVVFSVAILAFTYVIFNVSLQFPLYKGLIFGAP